MSGQGRFQETCAEPLPLSEGEGCGPERREVLAEDLRGCGGCKRRCCEGLREQCRAASMSGERRARRRASVTIFQTHMASCCSPTLSVGCYSSMCIGLSPLPLACHRAVGRYRLCCDSCRLRAPKCGDCNLARTLQLVESFSKIVCSPRLARTSEFFQYGSLSGRHRQQ